MNLNVLKYKITKRIIWLFGDKKYKSYSDALKDCISNGYENNAIIELVTEKRALSQKKALNGALPHAESLSIFPLISLINALSKDKTKLNVVDFGGADGGHYLFTRQVLNKDIALNWEVVETPEMSKAMQAFATDELSYSDDLDKTLAAMPKIDILHTSGTLQCTPNPYEFLEKMINLGAEYLIFNRQSLNLNDYDMITIQRSLLSWHGSNDFSVQFKDCAINYPHTNMSIKKFESMVQEKYDTLYTYEDTSGVKKVQNEKMIGKSYVSKKK